MNMLKWKIGLVLVLLLMILNTASASQIEVVGLCDTIGTAWDVKVVGPYAYIADYTGGLCIIDVSDPFEPTLEGLYTTGENFVGITVRDEYAYVASYEGFFIFDISMPSSPIKIGENSEITSSNVAVSGNYAYLVDIYLHIVDISNPSNPTKVGEYNISNWVYDVFVLGNYAYLANRGGFIIIDISDPFNPTKVWQYTACEARSVVVSDNYAYVATTRGLLVLDVSDKSNPLVVIQYPGSYRDIVVSENYAYVLEQDGNLSVIDMSHVLPVKIEEYDQPYWWITLDVSGDYIYIASASDGICILKVDTTPDTAPPTITIDQPQEGQIFTDDTITVSGSASDESGILKSVVTVNGEKVEIKGMNREHWSKSITLSSGINTIIITATDEEGNTKTVHRTVTYRNNGDIVVSSEPFGAKIYLDDVYEGTTPKTILDVSIGSHAIELTKDGYKSWSTSVYVTAGDTETISASLNPSSISTSTPNIGDIIVSSEPLGAEVHLDGEYKGVTPKLILDVPVGYHDIDLSMQGYQSGYTHVYVSAGATTKASAFLSPISMSMSTSTRAQKDSDGDGVPDKYDYAPSDPNVQSKGDIKTPGFEVIFAIVGLLSALCMLRRKSLR